MHPRIILILLTAFLFLTGGITGYTQKRKDLREKEDTSQNEQAPLKDRLFFGGNLGLQFGTITFIDVSPLVGYRLSDDRAVAVGGIYQYIKDNRNGFSTSIYGGRSWFRQMVFQGLFLQAEYQLLNHRVLDRFSLEPKRITTSAFLVGGGYRSAVGRNSYMSFTVMWDLIDDPRSPVPSPTIRGGVSIGF